LTDCRRRQPTRQLFSDLNAVWRLSLLQRLAIGVDGDKFDALDLRPNHAVHRVRTAPPTPTTLIVASGKWSPIMPLLACPDPGMVACYPISSPDDFCRPYVKIL
jgi:hypothetical protein